jgi:hypothetical protein
MSKASANSERFDAAGEELAWEAKSRDSKSASV